MQPDRDTPFMRQLHAAAKNGDVGSVQSLLAANPALTSYQLSVGPLYQAATFGHVDLCRHLLDAGADVDATIPRDLRTPIIMQSTALDVAAFYGHKDVARLLIEHGAELRAETVEILDDEAGLAFVKQMRQWIQERAATSADMPLHAYEQHQAGAAPLAPVADPKADQEHLGSTPVLS